MPNVCVLVKFIRLQCAAKLLLTITKRTFKVWHVNGKAELENHPSFRSYLTPKVDLFWTGWCPLTSSCKNNWVFFSCFKVFKTRIVKNHKVLLYFFLQVFFFYIYFISLGLLIYELRFQFQPVSTVNSGKTLIWWYGKTADLSDSMLHYTWNSKSKYCKFDQLFSEYILFCK